MDALILRIYSPNRIALMETKGTFSREVGVQNFKFKYFKDVRSTLFIKQRMGCTIMV